MSQTLSPVEKVAERLREMRIDCGYTQAQLAAGLGLSRSSIANMERQAQAVSIDHLCRAALFFRCEPADLLPAYWELHREARKVLRGKEGKR